MSTCFSANTSRKAKPSAHQPNNAQCICVYAQRLLQCVSRKMPDVERAAIRPPLPALASAARTPIQDSSALMRLLNTMGVKDNNANARQDVEPRPTYHVDTGQRVRPGR